MKNTVFKLEVYVPASHAEALKAALFAAGAGRLGNYDCCCWQTVGRGQFRPLDGSNPFLGRPGVAESVEEVKLELLMTAGVRVAVLEALRRAHPYETPAFYCWPVDVE